MVPVSMTFRALMKVTNYSTSNNLKMVQNTAILTGRPIESRTAPFSMTLNDPYPSFKVTPFFDAEYLRNGTRSRYSFNEILIGTYAPYSTVSFRMTLSDLE